MAEPDQADESPQASDNTPETDNAQVSDNKESAESLQTPSPRRDYFFMAIVSLIGIVAIWLLLTPLVPSVARSTMNRFHLRGDSFSWFAVQQPIPAMYNFANEYEISEIPGGMIESFLDNGQRRYINHFPMRVMTFANGRYTLQHQNTDRWVTLWSRYRGQSIESRVYLKALGNGRFELIRESEELSGGTRD